MNDLLSGEAPGFHVLILAADQASSAAPALQKVLATATAVAGQAVSVVVGAHARDVLPLLGRTGAGIVLNRRWEEGPASSLRAGIAALPSSCEAALIVSGNQAALLPDDLRRLAAAGKGDTGALAAALVRRAPSLPALFPRWCFPELLPLRGEQGTDTLLNRYAHRVVCVPMPHASVEPRSQRASMAAGGQDAQADEVGSTTIAALDLGAQTWLSPSALELDPTD